MFCIETIIIEVLLILVMSIELYKIRNHIISKQYYKLKPGETGIVIQVRAGVPDDGEETDAGSNTLLKLIQRINVRNAGKRDEYDTIKEIEELHEEEFRNRQMRRCYSFQEVREY